MKSKKILAIVLATSMMLGSSITALADGTSGGTNGEGSSEGHVDKKVINVVLPTVPEASTPFAYTMDPERLITATSAAKYAEGTTFPEAEGDTGVYFLTDTNTYANTSNTLQAINKSSCDITLTVKVKTTQKSEKDITLATAKDTLTATADGVTSPLLYLGLKVGTGTTVVSGTEQTITKTIAGSDDNYEVAVADGAYVYQVKSTATDWKAINLSMEGAVGEASVAADTTAPTLNVTWSYAEAASNATVDTDDQVTYTTTPAGPTLSSTSISATNNSITVTGGTVNSLVLNKAGGATANLTSSHYSYNSETGVVTITSTGLLSNNVGATITVGYSDYEGTSTITIEE